MLKSFTKAILFTLYLALPSLSWGDDDGDFQEHYQHGIKAYKDGVYKEAILHFQHAYELRRLPRLLINLGRAHLRLGNGEEAKRVLVLFLQTEHQCPEELRAEIESDIRQADALIPKAKPSKEPSYNEPKLTGEQLIPATFLSNDPRTRYEVHTSVSPCLTPCKVELKPGPQVIHVVKPRAFFRKIDLPQRPTTIRLRQLTIPQLVAGLILTPLGTAGTAVGGALLGSTTYSSRQEGIRLGAGIPLLSVGLLALGAGVVNLALVRGDRIEVLRPETP